MRMTTIMRTPLVQLRSLVGGAGTRGALANVEAERDRSAAQLRTVDEVLSRLVHHGRAAHEPAA
jgi:hypothetical protein